MPNPEYPFIDIREELKDLFSTTYQWFGLRQLDYSSACSCVTNSLNGSSTPDKKCSRCFGSGFKFTDNIVRGYHWIGSPGFEFPAGPGVVTTQSNQLILEWNRTINKNDLVLFLDQEPSSNKLKTPFKILRQFIVQDAKPIRADNSRIEFWKCYLEERTSSNYRPGEEGTNFTYKGNRSNAEPI